jgi:predicted transcriptional regulator of viral defense system
MTKYIEKIHELKIFHKKDVVALTTNENAAKELLRRYKQQQFILQIRRNLYAATDLATKAPLVSKFEIASQINDSSYLAYHSALEYYGLAHQVFYEMAVASNQRFSAFEYDGIRYFYAESKTNMGVVNPQTDSLIKVTELERTMIDCIDRIDLSGGLEELIQCFSLITYVNENKLIEYLSVLNKQFLYQKTGLILRYFQNEMNLSEHFFEYCKSKIDKSIRYLTYPHESDTYFKEWQLYAPQNILSFLEQGGGEYV